MTTWVATGYSLVASTLAAAFYANGGDASNFLRSDDHFIGGLAVSVVACGCFIFGSTAGWWFGSRHIAFWTSLACIAFTAALMALSDYLHDFGEGDQFVAAIGMGLAFGGSAGLLTFAFRGRYALAIGALAPPLLFCICFVLALRHINAI